MSNSLDCGKLLNEVRKKSPLVHNITNFVVMNTTANVLLSVGASPVMAHASEEVEEMVGIAQALVINIGTLSASWVETMKLAMTAAKKKQIPIVFDPVGCGATSFRTQTCKEFVEQFSPDIIRGNASEILALAGSAGLVTKGVDSTASSEAALEAAKKLATLTTGVVCVSGKVDYVIDKNRQAKICNGHAWMSKVTGMGCSATAVIAAFAAVTPDFFSATIAAMSLMGVAAEQAKKNSSGLGTFQVQFINELFAMTPDFLNQAARIECC